MLTVGSDPEFFALGASNKILPPHIFLDRFGEIGEYKGLPMLYEDDEFILHIDGAAFEVVLKNPRYSLTDVHQLIYHARQLIADRFDIYLSPTPAAVLDEALTKEVDENFLESLMYAGCNPDYDPVLEDLGISTPTIQGIFKFKDSWRYAGGHISVSKVGLKEKIAKEHKKLAIIFSVTVGLRLVLMSSISLVELERRRSKIYGTPAKYRPKKVELTGIFEYRTPSNQWTSFRIESIDALDSDIRMALSLFESDWIPERDVVYSAADAILNFDKTLAEEVRNRVLETV